MFGKWLWIRLGLVFIGMVTTMLVVTGVFREGIWPRIKPGVEWAYGKWQPQPDRPETKRTVAAVPAGDRGSGIGDRRVKSAGELKGGEPQAGRELKGGEPQAGRELKDDRTRLARLYTGMRPRDAAPIFEKLEPSLATQILTRIPDRQAARILGAMEPEIAARLTRGIAKEGS